MLGSMSRENSAPYVSTKALSAAVGSVSRPMLAPGAPDCGCATCSFQPERKSQCGLTAKAVSNCLRSVTPL